MDKYEHIELGVEIHTQLYSRLIFWLWHDNQLIDQTYGRIGVQTYVRLRTQLFIQLHDQIRDHLIK